MKNHRLWGYKYNLLVYLYHVLIKAFNFQIQDKTFLISGEILKEGDSLYLRSSVDGTVSKSKLVILDNTIYLFFPEGSAQIGLPVPKYLSAVSSGAEQSGAVAPMTGTVEKVITATWMNEWILQYISPSSLF